MAHARIPIHRTGIPSGLTKLLVSQGELPPSSTILDSNIFNSLGGWPTSFRRPVGDGDGCGPWTMEMDHATRVWEYKLRFAQGMLGLNKERRTIREKYEGASLNEQLNGLLWRLRAGCGA